MPLLRGDTVVADRWLRIVDDAPIPAAGAVLLPLTRLEVEAEYLWHRPDGLGVELLPDEPVERLEEWVEHLELVALRFPAFADGRAFSAARILRQRYGYRGELRATGEVLVDQRQFMLQCGFDSFEVADGRPFETWQRAQVRMPLSYQVGYAEALGPAALSVFRARHDRPAERATG